VVAYTRYDLTWYVEQMNFTNFWPATITNPDEEDRFSCKHVLVYISVFQSQLLFTVCQSSSPVYLRQRQFTGGYSLLFTIHECVPVNVTGEICVMRR
jgi:hypothetical protein